LAAIKLKYDQLEKEFLANRKKVSKELNRYMERKVGTVWTELSNNRRKIEAKLRQDNQVCYNTVCVFVYQISSMCLNSWYATVTFV